VFSKENNNQPKSIPILQMAKAAFALLVCLLAIQHAAALLLNTALRRSPSSVRLQAARGDVTVIGKGAMIEILADKTGMSKKIVEEVMECFTETIREEVLQKGNEVRVVQLGTFKKKISAPRRGRNPKTGEEMQIAGGESVGFTVSSSLKVKNDKKE